MTTTNYINTFIEVADDCPTAVAEHPPSPGTSKSVAALQHELITRHPFEFTSDDVLFEVFAVRHGIPDAEKPARRVLFFAKYQACLRSSPLGKRYGWGIHHDHAGRIALVALDSSEYQALRGNDSLKHVKALRTRRG